jgi:hypothetical protein
MTNLELEDLREKKEHFNHLQ